MTRTETTKKAVSSQRSADGERRKIPRSAIRDSQSGYSLISLMAMMTLLAIAMLAVAPSVQQQVEREKELETIRRGEEVAEAIRQYVLFYNGAKYPNSIDDLLEGLPYGTKKRQILRASAAVDPLSEDGKWRLISVESQALGNFARRVQTYNGGSLPTSETVPQSILSKFGIFYTNLENKSGNGGSGGEKSEADTEDLTSPADDDGEVATDNTPFIGVASQSKRRSFIAYYGIENHSKWIFTPLFRGSGSNVNQNTFRDRDRPRRTQRDEEVP